MRIFKIIAGYSECCGCDCKVFRAPRGKFSATILYQCNGCGRMCQIVRTGPDTYQVDMIVDMRSPMPPESVTLQS